MENRRFLVLVYCLLVSFGLQAQIPVQYIGTTNNRVIIRNQGRSDSAWGLPNLKTTTNLMSGQLAYNKDFRGLEVYDTATARWYSILSLQLRDGLVSGGNVSWTGSGLNFFVSESVYVIGGVLYFGNDTTVTLATADGTNPRQDVIALNNIGVFVLTGTPAADPAKPQVTPGSELELTSILVAAGTTTPTGITQAVIYDENTESTVTSSFTANADNTSNVYRGSKSINASSHGSGAVLAFEFDNAIDLTEYSLLTFYIYLKADYANNVGFNIKWINKNGFLQNTISSNVTITNNNYNYSRTTDGLYQTIQVPLSAFLFSQSPTSVDIMEITMTNAGAGFYMDYINLQGGVSIPSAGVVSFNGRAGNVTSTKDDYDQWFPDTSYRRADSVFWVVNGAEKFQYIDSTGGGGGGSGTVTSFAFTNSTGITGTVTNATTTPTLGLVIDSGAIANFSAKVRSLVSATYPIQYTIGTGVFNLDTSAGHWRSENYYNTIYLKNITGLITQGWNTKLSGSGTPATPYVISVDTTTQTLTDGATITFNANSGVSAKVTITASRTLAFSNFHNGMFLSLVVIQDGTGGWGLTLPASTRVIAGGAGAVTLTTAANSHDILTFWKINDVIYCNYGKNYN